jgi:hypothetical protein
MTSGFIQVFYCDSCGKSSREPMVVCEWCASTDITCAQTFHRVFDDTLDDARLAEIRANSDPVTGRYTEQYSAELAAGVDAMERHIVREELMPVPQLMRRQAGSR